MPLFSDLHRYGQRIWLDNLTRGHLRDGRLARLIEQVVTGVTSNLPIFLEAVTETADYAIELDALRKTEPDPERRYEALIAENIRAACDRLQPVYVVSGGDDGYVSLEVAPRFAHDEENTVAEARRLHALIGRDNLLIKVPGTAAGVRAFERLTAEGVRVYVTLLFSLHHVVRVFEAYLRGARRWLEGSGDPLRLKAVASLFLSRVDTLVDKSWKRSARNRPWRCAAKPRSPSPSWRIGATRTSSRATATLATCAGTGSGRPTCCGQAAAPRTRPTAISCTSSR